MMFYSTHTSAPMLMRGNLPHRALHPTDRVQQDPTQPTTRHSRRGRTGRERHDVEADVDEGDPQAQTATDRTECAAAPHQHQPHALSAHEMAWCRLIVELPLHQGGLGITPLPASGMAAFYSANAHMVSWLCSLPHASEWVAGKNLAAPTLGTARPLKPSNSFTISC